MCESRVLWTVGQIVVIKSQEPTDQKAQQTKRPNRPNRPKCPTDPTDPKRGEGEGEVRVR